KGDGTFAAPVDYPVGFYPESVAIADLNGDTKPDLAVAVDRPGGNGTVAVLLGKGDGTFARAVEYAVREFPNSVAVADLNGDSKPDLASANSGSDSVSVLLGQTSPYISITPTAGPKGTPVTVAGSDFMPGETVSVTYKTRLASPKSISLCSGTADASSAFSCQGTIPNNPGGPRGAQDIVA